MADLINMVDGLVVPSARGIVEISSATHLDNGVRVMYLKLRGDDTLFSSDSPYRIDKGEYVRLYSFELGSPQAELVGFEVLNFGFGGVQFSYSGRGYEFKLEPSLQEEALSGN